MLSILWKGELSYDKVNHLEQRRVPPLAQNHPKHKITISNFGLAENCNPSFYISEIAS